MESTDAMLPKPARPQPISENHPLRHLFRNLTEASFEQVGHADPELTVYVTGLLVDFTHIDNLYRVRDAKGRRLEYLVDFQLESQRGDKGAAGKGQGRGEQRPGRRPVGPGDPADHQRSRPPTRR